MESDRFDRLAKLVGKASSRRTALRGLLGGAGAGALALMGAGQGDGLDAEARRNRNRRNRKKNECNGDAQCRNPRNPCKRAVCQNKKCRKKNEPDGQSCGDEQVCRNGRCGSACEPVCTGGQECRQAACACPDSGECTITPSSLDGWTIGGTEPVEFVEGPATPPLGDGSVQLSTPAGGKATLRNQEFAGLAIVDLETLSYSTYQQDGSSNGLIVPAVKFEVLYDSGSEFATLVFEPTYSANSDVAPDEWQTWDLLDADARWWSTRAIPADDPEICANSCFVPWEDVLDAIPDAFITSVLVETGSGTAGAVGNVDALNINGLIFNFEPDA